MIETWYRKTSEMFYDNDKVCSLSLSFEKNFKKLNLWLGNPRLNRKVLAWLEMSSLAVFLPRLSSLPQRQSSHSSSSFAFRKHVEGWVLIVEAASIYFRMINSLPLWRVLVIFSSSSQSSLNDLLYFNALNANAALLLFPFLPHHRVAHIFISRCGGFGAR